MSLFLAPLGHIEHCCNPICSEDGGRRNHSFSIHGLVMCDPVPWQLATPLFPLVMWELYLWTVNTMPLLLMGAEEDKHGQTRSPPSLESIPNKTHSLLVFFFPGFWKLDRELNVIPFLGERAETNPLFWTAAFPVLLLPSCCIRLLYSTCCHAGSTTAAL